MKKMCVAALSLAVSTVSAKQALNHDEPPLILDGKQVPFILHYAQEADVDIKGEIREIPNFLPDDVAERLYSELMSYTVGDNEKPNPDHWLFTTPDLDRKLRSNERIHERYEMVHNEMRDAQERQDKPGDQPGAKHTVLYTKWELSKSPDAQELHKKFWEEMESDRSAESIAAATGQPMGHVTHSFISMFHQGDFLSTHAASRWEGRGEWAYILYLSKNWKPEYGGSLYLLDSKKGQENTVAHVCVPEFNKLVLFKLKPHCPWHFVSQVRADRGRMGLIGWYSTGEQKEHLRSKGLLHAAPPFLIPLNGTVSKEKM